MGTKGVIHMNTIGFLLIGTNEVLLMVTIGFLLGSLNYLKGPI